MSIEKNIIDNFLNKYINNVMEIFLLKETADFNFGIFSWNNLDDHDEFRVFLSNQLDLKINSIKNNVLIFVNCLFGKAIKEIKNENTILQINKLTDISIEFFEYVISNKFNFLKRFDAKTNDLCMDTYENLIYQFFVFTANVFNTKPFNQQFKIAPKM